MHTKSIYDFLNDVVARQPKALAWIQGSCSVTYAELSELVNLAMTTVQSRTDIAGGVIALLMDHSVERVAFALALMELGAVVAPLDITLPELRTQQELIELKPVGIIYDVERKSIIPNELECWALTGVISSQSSDSSKYRRNYADPDSPAYIVFTSGSTDIPKGIVCSQAQIIDRLVWRNTTFALDSTDSILLRSLTSSNELFGSVMCGATMVCVSRGKSADISHVSSVISQLNITAFNAVPTMLEALIRLPDIKRASHLSHIFCAGEVLTLDLLRRLQSKTKARVHNFYGQRETSYCLYHTCQTAETYEDLGRIPIGVETHLEVSLCVCDPIGTDKIIVGEIVVEGTTAIKYLNSGADGTGAFVVAESGGRVFHTGDFAYMDDDGTYHFVGRKDRLVKIRGTRVYLDDLENTIQNCNGVKHAAVILTRSQAAGVAQLSAFYVLEEDSSIGNIEIREYLFRTIQKESIPHKLIPLETMPLTHTGKIDRSVLGNAYANQVVMRDSNIGITGRDVMDLVMKVWEETLGDDVLAETNFFVAGGDSLAAAIMLASLEDKLSVRLTYSDIVENPTVETLVKLIKQHDMSMAAKDPIYVEDCIANRRSPEYGKLSNTQKRIISLEMSDYGGHILTSGARIPRRLSRLEVEECLGGLVDRHRLLRATAANQEDLKESGIDVGKHVHWIDVPTLDSSETQVVINDIRKALRTITFDAESAPPWAVAILQTESGLCEIWYLCSSALFDKWSVDLLLDEMLRILDGASRFNRVQPAELVEPLMNPSANGVDAHVDYWKTTFAKASTMLEKMIRSSIATSNSFSSAFPIGSLGKVSSRLGTTNAVALWGITLWCAHAYSRGSGIHCGTLYSNRNRMMDMLSIGQFSELGVFWIGLNDSDTIGTAVAKLHMSVARGAEYSDMSFVDYVDYDFRRLGVLHNSLPPRALPRMQCGPPERIELSSGEDRVDSADFPCFGLAIDGVRRGTSLEFVVNSIEPGFPAIEIGSLATSVIVEGRSEMNYLSLGEVRLRVDP